jgi:hypothetical protein
MHSPPITVLAAQEDMRTGYHGGAPGVIVSASVWLLSGIVGSFVSPTAAVWTLLIGGMFIHPVALGVVRLLGRSASHTPGNPFGPLALAVTAWLLLSLPLAYVVSIFQVELFFPAMLLIIGGRYATFTTLYGNRTFWLCAASLSVAGFLLASGGADPALSAFTGAALEGAFGIYLWRSASQEARLGHLSSPAQVAARYEG